ncbi:MAG: T9SS type A sorting domain-containing protein, partial [Chlorobi bacterium]|nr:T9SS type A sorting domain-containing protein [Chlorobiota bacterium]
LGCLATDTFITFVPVQHELALAIGSVSSDGLTATVTASGGIPPYKYQLNNGAWQSAAVFTDLPAGTNTITVMDAHECSASVDTDVDDISVTADPASGSSVAPTFTVDLIFNRDVIVPTDGVTVTGATTSSVTGTGSTYTVSITADELATVTVTLSNTIEDNAGNAFAGGTFTYTVNDTEAPTVVSVSPTGDVGDDTTFDLVLTLSENVIPGAGNMVVYNGTTAVATFGPGDVTISGSTVSVAVSLDKYTSYFVQVDAGFVTDASGNGIAGITSPTEWAFNTGDFNVAVEQLDVAKLKVYPNPFSNYIKIDNNQILTRVIISNIAGQRVIDIVNPEHEVRTPNLVSGVYVVTMFTENGVAKTERIVKR